MNIILIVSSVLVVLYIIVDWVHDSRAKAYIVGLQNKVYHLEGKTDTINSNLVKLNCRVDQKIERTAEAAYEHVSHMGDRANKKINEFQDILYPILRERESKELTELWLTSGKSGVIEFEEGNFILFTKKKDGESVSLNIGSDFKISSEKITDLLTGSVL